MEKSAHNGGIVLKFDIWDSWKSVEKIQVSLKYDKDNGYFAWRPLDHASLISS